MSGTKGPITTFIVEPFVPHKDEYYLSIVSDRLGAHISFSECGGIDIEENWDKVYQIKAYISDLFFFSAIQIDSYAILFCYRLRVLKHSVLHGLVQVKAIFVPTEQTTLTNELCAPLVATLPLEVTSLFLNGLPEFVLNCVVVFW